MRNRFTLAWFCGWYESWWCQVEVKTKWMLAVRFMLLGITTVTDNICCNEECEGEEEQGVAWDMRLAYWNHVLCLSSSQLRFLLCLSNLLAIRLARLMEKESKINICTCFSVFQYLCISIFSLHDHNHLEYQKEDELHPCFCVFGLLRRFICIDFIYTDNWVS